MWSVWSRLRFRRLLFTASHARPDRLLLLRLPATLYRPKPKFVSRLNCGVENTLRHAIRTSFHAQTQTAGLDRFAIRRMKLNLSGKIAHDVRAKWERVVIVVGITVCSCGLNVFTVRANTSFCIVFFFGTLVCVI